MTKKNITITAVAAVMLLAMAAVSMAGPYHGKGYGRGCPGQGKGFYSQFTPEKQAAVDKIIESYRGRFDELRTEMWTKHATLQAMVNGGDANEEKIGGLTAELSALRDKMWSLHEKMTGELEKETGIEGFGGRGLGCAGYQGGQVRGDCPGYSQSKGFGPGYGKGYGASRI